MAKKLVDFTGYSDVEIGKKLDMLEGEVVVGITISKTWGESILPMLYVGKIYTGKKPDIALRRFIGKIDELQGNPHLAIAQVYDDQLTVDNVYHEGLLSDHSPISLSPFICLAQEGFRKQLQEAGL